ncbi:ABC transporter ATP-binding protein [Pseudoflavonifractor sp. 60]|uniref:ABC transporter ATP-binding protein n=1 Tax=Pseudoflavonifractor sp. 60 TaxID=2304576 RepID=UPI00136CB4EF|nr:ABC transporter ATP-binding protein [Pseudoflavonifractor sp. 60]NBI66109.1 ABC transporter ATP-binding protein [Pseudoflavonifractor sp. 60]
MELLIDHVSKRFKDKKAVSDISLELTPGVWGLLGANGAGKTTLMRMIAGIMRPTSGQVVYDGVSIQTLGERYRDVFGFLPQDFGFHQEFTVKDYLAYVAALKGLPERQSWRRIHELLERVSLLDVYNKKIAKLSGGMRRRVGIAQALLNDPEVLILDEPTGGLDPGERVRFRNLLSEFAHDRIVLISTHIVPDVEYIATCHAIIKEGKLLATGTTEELTRLVEDRVWSCTIPADLVQEYESKLQITNLRNETDGSVSIRYLSDRPRNNVSTAAAPRLEDLYLWMFPESSGESDRRYQ